MFLDKPLPAFFASKTLVPLAIGVIALYASVLGVGFFMGAYVDDILSPLSSARAGYDGWRLINMYPQCGPGNIVAIPLTLLPGSSWSWMVHALTDDLYVMRFIAVAILCGWLGYTTWFLKRCLWPACPAPILLAGLVSLTGLGTEPLALLLNRPETGMIFAVTFFASLPFIVTRYPAPGRRMLWATGTAFFLLTSWFLSVHPKSMVYVPLLLVAALSLCRWSRRLGVALAGLVTVTAWQAWDGFWQLKTFCRDSAPARHEWESAAVPLGLAFKNRALFWEQVKQNLWESATYASKILFQAKTTWLPPMTLFAHEKLVNSGIAAIIAVTCFWIVQAHLATVGAAGKSGSWKHPFFLLSPCLLTAALVQCALQTDKNFYNSCLIWVTLLLAGVAAADYLAKHSDYWQNKAHHLKKFYLILCGFCALSLWCLFSMALPAAEAVLETAPSHGLIDNGMVEEPGMSDSWGLVNPSGYGAWAAQVRASAASCHIPLNAAARHIGVDLATYLPLKDTYQPFYLVFRLHEFDKASVFFAFLRGARVSGPGYLVPHAA